MQPRRQAEVAAQQRPGLLVEGERLPLGQCRHGPHDMSLFPRPPGRGPIWRGLCHIVGATEPSDPPSVWNPDSVRRCYVRRGDRTDPLARGKCVAQESPREGPMAKVMVVDDAYSDLALMESILKGAGHQVVSLIDGDQLEDRLTAERPDVLLLDIVMPKRNGYEILRSLKRDERTKTTPVVLVSSKNQESDRTWGKRQGADEYLAKPFTSAELLSVVGRFAR